MTTAAVKTTPERGVGLARIINARVTYRNAPMHMLEKFTFKDIDMHISSLLKGEALTNVSFCRHVTGLKFLVPQGTQMSTSSLMSGYLQQGCQKRTWTA